MTRRETFMAVDVKDVVSSEIAGRLARSDGAYTVFLDGAPLFSAGIHLFFPGSGEVWFVGIDHDLMRHNARATTDAARSLLETWARDHKLHRVQASVDAMHTEAWRFVLALGFKMEGEMKQYGPNREDYYRFVRFFS
jgi:RimJ/RimL family protein N-acetyltransferase